MTAKTLTIGSVSHGTMRTEDLLPVFLDLLEEVAGAGEHESLIMDANNWIDRDDDDDEDTEEEDFQDHEATGSEIVNELIDALDQYCPAYCYFGAHPGDGGDYGVWPCMDDVEQRVRDNDGLVVSDLSEVPDDYAGEVLYVNDHGNVTLYEQDGKGRRREIWAVV